MEKFTQKIMILLASIACLVYATAAPLHAVDEASLKSLESNAWKHAYADRKHLALAIFKKAARLGSWQAAQFLANEYNEEHLLSESDADHAGKKFAELANTHEKRLDEKYPFVSSTPVSRRHLLEDRIQKLRAIQIARITPWYKEVLEEFPRAQQPETSALYIFNTLVGSSDSGAGKCRRGHLFEIAVPHASRETLQEIFKKMKERHKRWTGHYSSSFKDHIKVSRSVMRGLDLAARKNDAIDELKDVYGGAFFYLYYDWILGRDQLSDFGATHDDFDEEDMVCAFQELYCNYAKLDKQDAQDTMFGILGFYMKEKDHRISEPVSKIFKFVKNGM